MIRRDEDVYEMVLGDAFTTEHIKESAYIVFDCAFRYSKGIHLFIISVFHVVHV